VTLAIKNPHWMVGDIHVLLRPQERDVRSPAFRRKFVIAVVNANTLRTSA